MPARPEAGATLDAWLAYLEALHSREIELGLDRVLLVFRRLFRGPWPTRVITVAGTNGKGTTVAALDLLLRTAGRRTATYTSPHLHRYNERVCVDGDAVSDAELVKAFETVEAARGTTPLTYFEFGTLAALVIFQGEKPDDVILEVGLGGRLDAVNILDPDLAIITTVDIDHADWLGTDRETIGYEKAGILRPGIAAVLGEADPPRSVLQQANAQRVTLRRRGGDGGPDNDYGWDDHAHTRLYLKWREARVTCAVPPTTLPDASVLNAIQAVAELGVDPRGLALEVLGNLAVAGRFERLGRDPEIVVDVGHNPQAARWLAARLDALPPAGGGRTFAIYAGLADKDSAAVAQALATSVDHWFLAGLDVARGLSAAALAERVGPVLADSPWLTLDSVEDALAAARERAGPADRIIVFGSFHTVAAARQVLLGPPSA